MATHRLGNPASVLLTLVYLEKHFYCWRFLQGKLFKVVYCVDMCIITKIYSIWTWLKRWCNCQNYLLWGEVFPIFMEIQKIISFSNRDSRDEIYWFNQFYWCWYFIFIHFQAKYSAAASLIRFIPKHSILGVKCNVKNAFLSFQGFCL